MTSPSDDEIHFIIDTGRRLAEDVQTTLRTRGWAATDSDPGDEQPLEWFWPPTAPLGYGGLPGWGDVAMQRRTQMYGTRRTPWTLPTRINRSAGTWTVHYGAATAQRPDAALDYHEAPTLIADLERIECWPMSVEETAHLRAARLIQVTTAMARDEHYLTVFPTEPYASRLNAIRAHQASGSGAATDTEPTATPHRPGNLTAQYLLVDAEAWASAVRSTRAGGAGWGIDGPTDS